MASCVYLYMMPFFIVSVQFMLIPLKQGTFDRPYFCETEKIKSF